MIGHIGHCAAAFANNPLQLWLALLSLAVAAFSIIAMRMEKTTFRGKVILIYTHLTALFFVPVFFVISMNCGGICDMTLIELAAYSLPSALAFSFALGFFGVPYIYIRAIGAKKAPESAAALKFVAKHAEKMNISAPSVFFADSQAPYAFSFSWPKSMIVLSVGLSDILGKKELEAVLLHELHHAQSKASMLKLSAFFMRLSPFAALKRFNGELDLEEDSADRFAAEMQGTLKYLASAKRKVSESFFC